MRLKKLSLQAAVMVVALLVVTTSAWADFVAPLNVFGQIWKVYGNWGNAPYSDPVSGSAMGNIMTNWGTFSASEINFDTRSFGSSSTLGQFLSTASGINTAGVSDAALASQMSNCSTSGPVMTSGDVQCFSTVIHLWGQATFPAQPFTLLHDDGANLNIAGGAWEIDAPAPVSPTPTSFLSSGFTNAKFDLYYMGTNRNPEVLILTTIPEPASILGLGTLLILIGAKLRRKKT